MRLPYAIEGGGSSPAFDWSRGLCSGIKTRNNIVNSERKCVIGVISEILAIRPRLRARGP